MRILRTLFVLLICAALHMGSALHAQPRPGAADSHAGMNIGAPNEPSVQEIAGSTPCGRWSMEAPGDSKLQYMYDDRMAWVYAAWFRICLESVRSDAVALAWSQGLDERGVTLGTNARASKLADMEGWLRRLKGRFRIEGKRWDRKRTTVQVLGSADCFGISGGPGVSCLISANWKPDKETGKGENAAPDTAIRPQVLLFGLDPGAMEIRVTHVDAIAVELHGILQDGAVILSEQSPPAVTGFTPPDLRDVEEWMRDSIAARIKGNSFHTPFPKTIYYQTSLSGFPLDDFGNSARRLSRVAITDDGQVDMKFYVFSPQVWGYDQPIEFDLKLYREPQLNADRSQSKPSVPAAGFTCANPAGSGEQQGPDEAAGAAGVKKEAGTREMQAWLGRLVGKYTVEGYVDLCGKGNSADQRAVTGEVDCIAAGSPPSVHCKFNVSWSPATSKSSAPLPSGASNLSPAQFLFSLFTVERFYTDQFPIGGSDKRGLSFLQMDNRGIVEGAWSELMGDTFMSRENCVDIPGNCHKTTLITASPDSDEISMRVDVEMSGKQVLRQVFLLRRKSNVQ